MSTSGYGIKDLTKRTRVTMEKPLRKTVLILAAYSLIALFLSARPVSADNYKPNDYFASIEKSNKPDWMSQLPDDRLLSDLSIPGTHDTMAVWGNLGKQSSTPSGLTADIAKVQQRFNESGKDSLARQLQAGIRAIDIRVGFRESKHKDDPIPSPQLGIYHGVIYEKARFSDVLQATSDFLKSNSKETILMRLKLERGNNSGKFKSVLKNYHDKDPNGNIIYEPSWSEGGPIPIPKLGDVRGKVVIIILDGINGGYGIDLNSVNIQDKFTVKGSNGSGKKFKYVVEQLVATGKQENQYKLMINHLSAITKIAVILPGIWQDGPSALAHDINQMVWTFLDKNYAKISRTGILMMDYPGWKLIDKIISFNYRKP